MKKQIIFIILICPFFLCSNVYAAIPNPIQTSYVCVSENADYCYQRNFFSKGEYIKFNIYMSGFKFQLESNDFTYDKNIFEFIKFETKYNISYDDTYEKINGSNTELYDVDGSLPFYTIVLKVKDNVKSGTITKVNDIKYEIIVDYNNIENTHNIINNDNTQNRKKDIKIPLLMAISITELIIIISLAICLIDKKKIS